MIATAPNTVANNTLPLLVTLILSRKQARWQWSHCAGEHKQKWVYVLKVLDARIKNREAALASQMDMFTFRMKREMVE